MVRYATLEEELKIVTFEALMEHEEVRRQNDSLKAHLQHRRQKKQEMEREIQALSRVCDELQVEVTKGERQRQELEFETMRLQSEAGALAASTQRLANLTYAMHDESDALQYRASQVGEHTQLLRNDIMQQSPTSHVHTISVANGASGGVR